MMTPFSFFDTNEEAQKTREMQHEFRPVTVEELEGKRRKDIEQALIKRDVKRQKIQENHDQPAALAKAAEVNDPIMVRRKGRMMLPPPQVSELELEQIARMSTDAMLDEQVRVQQPVGNASAAQANRGKQSRHLLPMQIADGAGGEATRQLLGQYGPTPMRAQTPAMTGGVGARTAPAGDRIMMEAQNLARLNNMETPLLGGANPELHPSDFSGVTPRAPVTATPNPLLLAATPRGGLTPSLALASTGRRPSTAIAGVPSTPSSSFDATPGRGGDFHGPGATPMRTPMRDELGLNDTDSMIVGGGRRAQQQHQAAMRSELRAGLSTLPAPQNEYQIEMPELPEDSVDGDEDGRVEDAADAKARRLREEEHQRQEEERRKSRALQRQLPRPVSIDLVRPVPKSASEKEKMSVRERAEDLLAKEIVAMLEHDNAKYPIPTGKEKLDKKAAKSSAKTAVPPLPSFNDEELKAAAELLNGEVAFVIKAMDHAGMPQDTYLETLEAVQKDYIWVPSKGRYDRAASATNTERIESVKVGALEIWVMVIHPGVPSCYWTHIMLHVLT